ncbi:MAG: glycosyltransferase [Segetibacter sp.]|jgi:glycosyltransferase involved in cell wall biosynthesis|nr:glycosyltransferase [Segetibacter sp.]
MAEKVSIVIATYNGEAYLKEQLESIFIQLPDNAEILISDNGSTDNTVEIIKQYKHPKIKLLVNKDKKGVINNFEHALNSALGEVIFLCDQDDIWLPNKIQVSLKYLETYDMVVSNCTIVNNNLEVIIPSWFEVQKSRKGLIKNLMSSTYMGSCMAFRRSVLKLALPFPAQVPMHDIWIGFVSELFFKNVFIEDKLILYRRHISNSSNTGEKSKFNLISKFEFRLNILKHIPLLLKRRYKVKAI